MLTVNIPEQLENKLTLLAQEKGQTKDYLLSNILDSYFQEKEESLLADEAYAEYLANDKKTLSLAEMEQKLGLAD